ncbi:MAG: hypothetical protein IJP18_09250, partial [Oscillospiraceae bacterium]|nr:hypothetical protein [Oscillospiraceae bacterium]
TLAGQYVGFCRVFDEQRKLYENSIEAAIETYRICIEKGYLEEFMKSHEKKVIDMMAQLFDEEVMRRQYDIASRKKEREEGRLEGRLEGRIEGRLEGRQEGRLEGKMENMLSTAQALIKLGSMSLENISMVTGLPLAKVQELSEINS